MKKLYMLGLIVLFSQCILSQEFVNPDLHRRVNFNIIRLIEKYESFCTFNGINSDESFYSLFTEKAIVYNDYLPSNKKQDVSPAEYYKITQNENTKSKIGVEISNVSLTNSLELKGNNIYIARVKLNKKIYFRNWNNFRYPDRNFVLNIEILVNTENADKIECNIKRISTENPLKNFSIARIDTKDIDFKIEPLRIDDKLLEMVKKEDEAIAFLPDMTKPQEALTIDSYDGYLNIRPDTTLNPDKNIYFVNVLYYNYDLGFRIHYNSTPDYSFKGNLNDIVNKTYGFGFGFDFNKKLGKIGRTNYFLNLGLGYEKNGIAFTGNYSNEGHEYEATDEDGADYKRQVTLTGITENINLNYFYLPVGGKINYFLFNQLSIESSLGLKLYYLFKKNFTASAQTAQYKGHYNEIDDLWMEHYYDFGKFENGKKYKYLPEGEIVNLTAHNSLAKIPAINFGIYASVGVNYRINQRLSASFNMGFDYAFLDLANKNNDYNKQYNNGSYNISDHYTDGIFDYHSLMYSYNKIIKSNLNFSLGLNYKF